MSLSYSTYPIEIKNGGVSVGEASILDFTGENVTATISGDTVTINSAPRVTTITSNATPTIDTDDCDAVTITALATDITSMTTNLSGTPYNFKPLLIRIKDDGTARAITWGASFTSYGPVLPTTTTANKVLSLIFRYDSVAAIWGCVSAMEQP